MGQTCQDDTKTVLSRPGEPGLTTRMVEKGIQQQHTQHEAEGSNKQQFIKKNVKLKLGSECKYNQNNSIGIKMLCGTIRSTSLGGITLRPETEYGP